MKRSIFSTCISLTVIAVFVFSPLTVFIPVPAEAAFNAQFQGATSALLSCTGASKGIANVLGFLSGQGTDEIPIKDKDANTRENCLKKISRTIVKQMLDKITQDTINWINSGFKGEPLYVKDPNSLFRSIADTEVYNFATLVGFGQGNYPFGRDFALSLIGTYKNKFQQNAQFSLNRYVSTGNYKDFYTNFNYGGWEAWLGAVANPANNPIGFNIIASEEIAKRTQDNTNSYFGRNDKSKINELRASISQSNGFLDMKKCVESAGGPSLPYVAATQSTGGTVFSDDDWYAIANDPNQSDGARMVAKSHICTKYETTTPGTVVSEQLTSALGNPLKSLDLNADFSDSLSAIFDALLNQLASQGLNALSNAMTPSQNGVGGGYGNQSGGSNFDQLTTTLQNQLNGSGWSTYGSDLNLKALLQDGFNDDSNPNTPNTTLIKIQEDWLVAMAGPNWEQSTSNIMNGGANGSLFWLVRDLKRLDYWVPGPRADWKEYVGKKVEQDIKKILTPNDTVQAIGSILDPGGIGTSIVNGIGTQVNTDKIQGMLGIVYDYQNTVEGLYTNKKYVDQWAAETFDTVAILTNTEISKIPNYVDERAKNQKEIEIVVAALNKLKYLKEKILPVYAQLAANPNDTIAKANLEKYKNIFYQVAPGIKSSQDLADVQGLSDLYEQEISYVRDLVFDVKKETFNLNFPRRPYADWTYIWGSDPEAKCWNPLRGPMGPGYPSIPGTPAASSNNGNPAGAMFSGYTPQQYVAEIVAHDPTFTGTAQDLINQANAGGFHSQIPFESGRDGCSFSNWGVMVDTGLNNMVYKDDNGDGSTTTIEGSSPGPIDRPVGQGDNLQDQGNLPYVNGGLQHPGFSFYEDLMNIY